MKKLLGIAALIGLCGHAAAQCGGVHFVTFSSEILPIGQQKECAILSPAGSLFIVVSSFGENPAFPIGCMPLVQDGLFHLSLDQGGSPFSIPSSGPFVPAVQFVQLRLGAQFSQFIGLDIFHAAAVYGSNFLGISNALKTTIVP